MSPCLPALRCRGRFALETLAVWAVLCLPINLLTCYMVTVAPDYDHLAQTAQAEDKGNRTEAAEGSRCSMFDGKTLF